MSDSTGPTDAVSGERYIPGRMDPEVDLEHWHRYAMAARLVEGRRVLDIACGEGYGSELMAQSAASVVGVDIDAATVAQAAATYRRSNLRFLAGSCTAIPLPDASIDVVVSFETIEHITEHEAMLAEIGRVLAPQGLCIISTPDRTIYTEAEAYENPFHLKELSAEEFEALLARHFRQVTLVGQKYVLGSLVTPLTEVAMPGFLRLAQARLGEPPAALPLEAKYLLGIASDGPLPLPGVSFLESRHGFEAQRREAERVNGLLRDIAADLETARAGERQFDEVVATIQRQCQAFEGAAADRTRERDAALAHVATLEAALREARPADAAPALAAELAALRRQCEAFEAAAADRAKERDAALAHVASLEAALREQRAAMQAYRPAADFAAVEQQRAAFEAAAVDRARERDGALANVASLEAALREQRAVSEAYRAACDDRSRERDAALAKLAALATRDAQAQP